MSIRTARRDSWKWVRAARLGARAVAVAASLTGLACGEAPPPAPAVARPVKMLTIGAGGSAGSFELPGEIRPALQADLAFEVSGQIVEFPVEEGQEVAAGAALARLDPRDFEAELDKVQAKLRQARADVDRYRYLVEQGVNPRRDLELKQRNLEVIQADARTARKALEDAVLRAPFTGTVARKLVEDVANVKAKEVVVILQDDSSLKINVDVPERVLARGRRDVTLDEVTARTRPRVVVTSLPDRSFPARLTELATSADPATRTFQATFAFDTPTDANVLPGMTAKVIVTRPADSAPAGAVAIPASAVVADESGAAYVWRVDPEAMTVSRAPIAIGELSGAEVEVHSGLSDGDVIAVSGVHQLREGMAVREYEN